MLLVGMELQCTSEGRMGLGASRPQEHAIKMEELAIRKF